jgi:hypothetical protein
MSRPSSLGDFDVVTGGAPAPSRPNPSAPVPLAVAPKQDRGVPGGDKTPTAPA